MEPFPLLLMMLCASALSLGLFHFGIKVSSIRFDRSDRVHSALKAGRRIHAHHANSACQEDTFHRLSGQRRDGEHSDDAQDSASSISLPLSAIGSTQSAKLSRRSIGSERNNLALQGTTSTVALPATRSDNSGSNRRQTVSISLAGRVRSRSKVNGSSAGCADKVQGQRPVPPW